MKRLPIVVTLSALCVAVPVAMAQQPFPLRVPGEMGLKDTVQVSVSYSLSLPLSEDDENAQVKALEKGRRLVYEMAAGECKVLQDTIAASCQVERLNVSSNIQKSTRTLEQVRISGTAGYRIKLK